MAFRQLTVGERLAFKGATSWLAQMMETKAVGNPSKCRWGFVPQSRLQEAMVDPAQRQRYSLHVAGAGSTRGGGFRPVASRTCQTEFAERGIDFREFSDGANACYIDMVALFSDPTVDFRDVELVSPRLSLFLNDCLIGYDAAGAGTPAIVVADQTVDTLVQDLTVEFGNIDHYDKWFGIYDGEEIRFHLLGGVFPEVTLANEYQGDCPRRLVASVLYKTKEKVWFPEIEDEPNVWSDSIHYFEFESPIKRGINWRLRNINKAIRTP